MVAQAVRQGGLNETSARIPHKERGKHYLIAESTMPNRELIRGLLALDGLDLALDRLTPGRRLLTASLRP